MMQREGAGPRLEGQGSSIGLPCLLGGVTGATTMAEPGFPYLSNIRLILRGGWCILNDLNVSISDALNS